MTHPAPGDWFLSNKLTLLLRYRIWYRKVYGWVFMGIIGLWWEIYGVKYTGTILYWGYLTELCYEIPSVCHTFSLPAQFYRWRCSSGICQEKFSACLDYREIMSVEGRIFEWLVQLLELSLSAESMLCFVWWFFNEGEPDLPALF